MKTWVYRNCYDELQIWRWRPWRTDWVFIVEDFG